MSQELLAAARALAIDGWTAEAIRGLRAVRLDALLLKGPAIARWLYPRGEERTYIDIDLLVEQEKLARVEAALGAMGYVLRDPEGERDRLVSGPHARAWWRPADGSTIDLHHTLPGGQYADAAVWSLLWSRAVTLPVAGESVPILDAPSRALLVALHAHHHGAAGARSLEDLRRAVDQLPDRTWREAAMIAGELVALPDMAAALRLVPGGPELAARLHLPGVEILDATRGHQIAAGFARLAAAGPGERLRLVGDELFPSRAFMHWWAPWSRGSRAKLGAAYVYRVGWLATHAAGGWRAWRRARNSTS
jgi:hypothetical protein